VLAASTLEMLDDALETAINSSPNPQASSVRFMICPR
jgi:hypothetical protein